MIIFCLTESFFIEPKLKIREEEKRAQYFNMNSYFQYEFVRIHINGLYSVSIKLINAQAFEAFKFPTSEHSRVLAFLYIIKIGLKRF